MNHSEASALLADYMEGDLPLAHRARFDAHLDECAECVAELEALRGTVDLLRGLPDPAPPPDLTRSVMRPISKWKISVGGRLVGESSQYETVVQYPTRKDVFSTLVSSLSRNHFLT